MGTKQMPSPGRVVHVNRENLSCLAATVTYVWSPTMVNVGGFDRSGVPFAATSVVQQEQEGGFYQKPFAPPPGTAWHWPEYVAPIETED